MSFYSTAASSYGCSLSSQQSDLTLGRLSSPNSNNENEDKNTKRDKFKYHGEKSVSSDSIISNEQSNESLTEVDPDEEYEHLEDLNPSPNFPGSEGTCCRNDFTEEEEVDICDHDTQSVYISQSQTGQGLFAKGDVKKGELLFSEKPLVHIPFDNEYDAANKRERVNNDIAIINPTLKNKIDETLSNVSKNNKARFKDLAPESKGKDSLTSTEIFLSNFIPCNVDDVGKPGESFDGAVFAIASRMNHSCTPNVQHWWDEKHEIELFFAARDISAGEELCIAYVDPLRRHEDRQGDLLKLYDFKCNCRVCASSEDTLRESDARRGILSALDKQVYSAVDMGEYDHAVSLIDERMEVLKDEGLDTPKNLLRCEYDGYVACLNSGNIQGMHVFLQNACVHADQSFGKHSEISSRLRMEVQELGFHAAVTDFMC